MTNPEKKLEYIQTQVLITYHITYSINTLILPAIILNIIVSFLWFSHQTWLGRQLAAQLAQAALRGKSWKETIFKIMAAYYLVNEFTADVTKQSL